MLTTTVGLVLGASLWLKKFRSSDDGGLLGLLLIAGIGGSIGALNGSSAETALGDDNGNRLGIDSGCDELSIQHLAKCLVNHSLPKLV